MTRIPNEITDAVWAFKREFLRHHLLMGDSIAATARRLGIERTYLVRLKRDLGIEGPRAPGVRARHRAGQP